MNAPAPARRDRLRAMLADLKMPGALEAVDGILSDADGGDDSTASDRFADPARVAERSSKQLRTSFAPMASTRRSPKAGNMYRFMPSACARLVAGFQRSAQSARNAGANVRTVGA